MKLPDFREHKGFTSLLNEMRTEYSDDRMESPEWKDSSIDKLLSSSFGIEISTKEITRNQRGVLFYKGRPMVVFLRDYSRDQWHKEGWRPRIHICKCKTLQEYPSGKYVASNNVSGIYQVNLMENNEVKEEVEEKLDICRYCLKEMRLGRQTPVWQYFKEVLPDWYPLGYRKKTFAKVNIYTQKWYNISLSYRIKKRFKCEQCNADYSKLPYELHVHHINGDKSENAEWNLKALCSKCHAQQKGHEHMKKRNV